MFSQRRGAIFWPKRGLSCQKREFEGSRRPKREFGGPGGLQAAYCSRKSLTLSCCCSQILLLFCCYCSAAEQCSALNVTILYPSAVTISARALAATGSAWRPRGRRSPLARHLSLTRRRAKRALGTSVRDTHASRQPGLPDCRWHQ